MKKFLFLTILFCLFLMPVFAATRTISDAGGNWNATGSWTEGAVPVAGDDVVATATSGNLVVNANSANLKSFDLTGYAGTLSGSSQLTIVGATSATNACLFAGTLTWTGILNLNPTSSTAVINFTSGGLLFTNIYIAGNNTADLVVLQDNLSFTAVKTDTLRLTASSLNMNGKTISGNSGINRLLIYGTTLGTAVTININAGTFANADFRDITLDEATNLSAISGGSGNAGGNTNITFTTAANKYWVADTGSWSDPTNHWALASGGAAGANNIPLPQDDVFFDANSFSATSTVTADMPRLGKTIDWSASTQTTTFTPSVNYTIYGGLDLTGLNTYTSTNFSITFEGRGAFNLNGQSNNLRWVHISMFGGTLTLTSGFTASFSTGLNINNGIFDADTFNISAIQVNSSNSNVRTVNMGSGTWTVTEAGTANAWNFSTTTNLTLNAETSTILFGGTTGASIQTFVGGGLTYNNLTIQTGSTNSVNLTGSNTFNTFTINTPKTVKFTAGTTTTVSSFVATGTAVDPITITSVTSATHTLSDTAGTNTVSYCTISYSVAQGGATWDADDGTNTDGGNNTGWDFTADTARRIWTF